MSAHSLTGETKNLVSIEDARARWDDLIARVDHGEEWFITDVGGRKVAKLAPASQEPASAAKRWKAFGMLKGQIEIAPDFDEPLDDLKPYME